MRAISIFAILLSVSACGGGGGTVVQSTAPTGPQALVDNVNDAQRIGQLILLNEGANQAAFTAEGTSDVTFNGVMILDAQRDVPSGAYYGDMSAIVNFASGTLNGSAVQFIYFDDSGPSTVGTPVNGTLTLASAAGTVIPDDPATQPRDSFNIDVTGSIELVGATGPVSVAAGQFVDGAFAGDAVGPTAPGQFATADNVKWLAGEGDVAFANGSSFATLIVGE